MLESFNGWNAHAKWANTLELRRKVLKRIQQVRERWKDRTKSSFF